MNNSWRIIDNQGDREVELIACPPPPEWLSVEAKAEWLRVAPNLFVDGEVKTKVVALLEGYCVSVGLVRECEEMLRQDGKIVGGKVHPAFDMLLKSMREARGVAAQLGLCRAEKEPDPRVDDEKQKLEAAEAEWKGLVR